MSDIAKDIASTIVLLACSLYVVAYALDLLRRVRR